MLIPKFIPMPIEALKQGYWLVEACIIGYLDFYQRNEDFYCTNEELAELLCLSEATIKRALKTLLEDWIVEYSKTMKEWGWQLRKIELTQNGLLLAVNMSFSKGSNWAFHNINQEKKESKKKEKNQTSVSELVEAYREDERLNNAFREEDVLEWLEYKKNRKELYATIKWFIQQLVVVKRMVAMDKPQLDIQKRFSFAVNEAISEWRKWIHRDEKTERKYLATKKDLFPNPNLNE